MRSASRITKEGGFELINFFHGEFFSTDSHYYFVLVDIYFRKVDIQKKIYQFISSVNVFLITLISTLIDIARVLRISVID